MNGYLPPTRLHSDDIARHQPQGGQVLPAQASCGHRLQRIQYGGAPRHAAGMPVLQLAPGDQHERVVGIRALVGGNDVGRHQVHAAIGRVKVLQKDSGRAGVIGAQARVSHAGFTLQALPGDAPNAGVHGLAHFFINSRHTAVVTHVVPVQAHAPGHLLNDPQIGFGLARRLNGLQAQLHHAVSVGHGAGLLGPSGGGQHHVGQPRGFGHENILHHQMSKRRQGVAGVVQVRVAHGRVLAHDVHAAHLVRIGVRRQGLVHDLNYGVAGLIVQRRTPKILEPVVRCLICDPLVVGVHHGDEAGVTGALHVVLAAQRVQAGARFADLSSNCDQGNQAAGVVGAMHVLAHAHAPQDHGAFGLGKLARYFAQCGGRYAANGRHGLRAVALDAVPQGFKVAGPVPNKGLVCQSFFNDGMNQCVEHGHVGVRLELQLAPGVLAQVGAPGVGYDNFGTSFSRVFHPRGGHGMVVGGVGADHKNDFRVLHIVDLVAYCGRSHALQQRGHAGGMAQAGAVVDVVGAKAGAHQLLEQVGFFVAAFGRAKTGQ